MRKTYFILLAVVTALTLLFAMPSVAMLAAILTFGLAAIVLIPLPFLALGLWALLPAMLLRHRVARGLALVAGIAAVTLVLFAPPHLADRALARDLATRGDVAAAPLTLPDKPGIEIIRRANRDPDLYVIGEGRVGPLIGQQPCADACERLLMGGGVAWVRVVLTDDSFGNTRTATHALFVAGDDTACHAANPDLAHGPCLLYAPDPGTPADLTLVLDEDRTDWHHARFIPYQPMGYRTAAAHLGASDAAPVVWRASQVFHERPNGWVAYDFGSLGNGDGGGGIEFGRKRRASPPIDLERALQTMGLPLAAPRPLPDKAPGTESNSFVAPPPDAFDAARIASLIATGPEGTATFSNAFQQEVNGWHERLRWTPAPTDAERRIFCATLESTAIRHLSWDDQLIDKHQFTCP